MGTYEEDFSGDKGDIYGEGREALLEDGSLTAMEEAFMQGWESALEEVEEE